MKNPWFALWGLVFLMACDNQPKSAMEVQESKESLRGVKEATLKEKERYGKLMADRLESLTARIAALKAKAGDVTGEAKNDLDSGIKALEAKAQDLRKRLSDLTATSALQWEIIRADIESRFKNLEETFAQVASHFSA